MVEEKTKFTFAGCLGSVIGLGFSTVPFLVIGYILYEAWQFFVAPDLIVRLSNGLTSLGMCVGIVILVLFAITKIPESWFGKYTDDWN
jgi:uncharacterized membrane protein YraQ (UPF0718 family)